MIDEEVMTQLARVAPRVVGIELEPLAALFDALGASESSAVAALERAFAAAIDDDTARALAGGARTASDVAERFSRLRALVAMHEALR